MALEAFGVESVTVTITIQDCGHDDNYKHYQSVSLTLHHLALNSAAISFPGHDNPWLSKRLTSKGNLRAEHG